MTALNARWTLAPDRAAATWCPLRLAGRDAFGLHVNRSARGWSAAVEQGGRRYACDGHATRDDAQTWCEVTAWGLWAEARA